MKFRPKLLCCALGASVALAGLAVSPAAAKNYRIVVKRAGVQKQVLLMDCPSAPKSLAWVRAHCSAKSGDGTTEQFFTIEIGE